MNVFEQFNQEKEAQRTLIKQAADNKFITNEQRREFEQKLDNDVLTIGVIGQMKAGKSTFLNAFVFERDVLPAATTPMTAALTVITYGPEEKIEVEFYTREEWDEQRLTAQRELTADSSEAEKSKVQAAQELVEKSARIGCHLPELLGTKRTDTLDKLIEYVGADGQFVSITKSVKIYYPKEYLKGVEIVDTPGFNDPIVSREERTKDFLRRADAVLLMLYAGRPFDATDREIVFKHLSQCGIGKVVIGINKYDIPRENGETESEIKEYVKAEIKNACKASNDEGLKEMLKHEDPIPLSAEMALLSYLPMKAIISNDSYKHAWHRYGEVFGLGSQDDLREFSHFSDLAKRVQEIVMKEKGEILFNKTSNAIKAAVDKIGSDLAQAITRTKELKKNLELPDDELEEKRDKLYRAKRRLEEQLEVYLIDLKAGIRGVRYKQKEEVEKEVDSLCNNIIAGVEAFGRTVSEETIRQKVRTDLDQLETRIIPRQLDKLKREKERCIVNVSEESVRKFSRILNRMDSEHELLIAKLKELCNEDQIDNFLEEEETTEQSIGIGTYISTFIQGMLFISVFSRAGEVVFWNKDVKANYKEELTKLKNRFNIDELIERLTDIEPIKDRVKKLMFDDFIDPIDKDLKQIIENREGREKQRAEATTKLESLQKQEKEYKEKRATMGL
ncbi:hypothetical protein BHU09_03330 [Tannerella sp. oral taxon 808]|nr:hypothetical protein BHU09_03330 [Tannerella sp. oral taxon 808]